jgi:uncharacterized protein DUF3999
VKKIALLFLLLAGPLAARADTPLKPEDFAYGLPLQTDSQSSVYEVPLPIDVYQGAVRGDLGDLRIFNADGNVVPHAVAPGGSTEEEMTETLSLNVFPIREGLSQTPDALSVMIRQGGSGSEVNLQTQGNQAEQEPKKKIVAYLLSTSEVSGPIRALTLAWSGQDETFLLPATLEASDDLKSWRTLVDDGLIAQLTLKEGSGLSRKDKLEFPATKANYLRLKFQDAERIAPKLSLDSATASYVTGTKAAERAWTTVKGVALPNDPKSYVFDLGAPLPIDRFEVLLPEGNHAFDAEITANNKPEEDKNWQFSGLIYRLKQSGHEMSSGTLTSSNASSRTPQRYWYLEVKDDSAGFGGNTLSFKAGWVPEKVVFVAEGKGPYTLAYGSAVVRKARFDENALMQIQGGSGLQPGVATASKAKTLGGPERLVPPPPAPPSMKEIWGKRLAFAAMAAATLLLGWMAYRLSRQMA